MSVRTNVESFVVRFTAESGDDVAANWRGHIEHVQSGQAQYFTEMQTAVEFMQSVLVAGPRKQARVRVKRSGSPATARVGRKKPAS